MTSKIDVTEASESILYHYLPPYLPPSLPPPLSPKQSGFILPVKKKKHSGFVSLVLCPPTVCFHSRRSLIPNFQSVFSNVAFPPDFISRVWYLHTNTSCLFRGLKSDPHSTFERNSLIYFFFPEMPSLSYRPKARLWHSFFFSFHTEPYQSKTNWVMICLSSPSPLQKNGLTLNNSVLDTANYCSRFICYCVVISSTVIKCIILH